MSINNRDKLQELIKAFLGSGPTYSSSQEFKRCLDIIVEIHAQHLLTK